MTCIEEASKKWYQRNQSDWGDQTNDFRERERERAQLSCENYVIFGSPW